MSDTVFDAWSPDVHAPGLRSWRLGSWRLGSWSFGRRLARHAVKPALFVTLLVGGAAIVTAGLRHLPVPPPSQSQAAPPAVAWREIIKPVRIYNLEAPSFAGVPVDYSARRHTIGGGREDVLTLGTLDGDKPSLRLRIFRRAEEAPSKVPLYAALAHEAAQVGLAIGRSGLPDLLPTRFGRFEVADIALVRKDGVEAPCGGFRLVLDTPALTVTGLACGRHAIAPSHAEIGCLIERLDVASARDDRDLIDFFARSELRRNGACAGMRLGPDGLHAPWLDDKPEPAKMIATPKQHTGGKPATSRKRLRRR